MEPYIKKVSLSILLSLAFYGNSFAETTPNLGELSLEDLLELDVTVASKSKESIKDAPSSVSVFTQSDIRKMGIDKLEDLLNFVPGFQTTRDVEQGRTIRISSRGRGSALSESVLFLVNGQRMNDLYSGGVSLLNRSIPVENIKQVEIIRGPGSALYGSNAFLGVVNIVTLNNENNAQFNVGNLNSRSGSVNLSYADNDLNLSMFVKGFSDDGQEYKDLKDAFGLKNTTKDPIQGFDLATTLKYKNLTINARHTERTLKDFLFFGSVSNNIANENPKQSSINFNYEQSILDNLTASLFGGYSNESWRAIGNNVPKGLTDKNLPNLKEDLISGPNLDSYNTNLGLDIRYQLLENNNLSFGTTIERAGQTKVVNLTNHNPITLDYYGRMTEVSDPAMTFNRLESRNIFGAYIQDKHSFGDFLNITAGLRVDSYSDFGTSINPRASIVYKTPFDSNVKLMYGKAFRAPNFLELYDKNNPVDFGNTALKPETVQTFEASYTQDLKFANGVATYFNNSITDLITLDKPVENKDNPLNAPRFINKGDQNISGLEFELNTAIFTDLMLRGSYTHLFNKDLPVSNDFASLILNYKLYDFNFNVNGIFRGKIDSLAVQDPYFLLNSSIQYSLNDKVKLTLSGQNLMDTNYVTITKILPDGIANRGRTFNFGVMYQL